jgi:LysR family transcriptional activator of nhaA
MRIQLDGKTVWVNFHHLYCFYVVGAEGSLVAASAKLGIGQSALSIQIKQFEETLGSQLFDRSPRKLALNERGRLVFSYAQEIFRLGGEMLETLRDRPTEQRVHVKIGALDTIPKHLAVDLVKQALSSGDCSLSLVEGGPDFLLKELSNHQIDLVLLNFLPKMPASNLRVKRIASLPLWVVGGKQALPLRKGFPGSLDGQPFVVPTGDSHVRGEFESFCHEHSIRPELRVEAQDVMVQKLLVLEGVGLGVVPEIAVREYLEQKTLFQLGKVSSFEEELYLVCAERRFENPVAARLWREFRID